MASGRPWYSAAKIVILSLIFHQLYISSVFDCYFTSPVVHGMQRYGSRQAEAKRLVLFVGDGLRADLLLSLNAFPMIPQSPEVTAPYLRGIIETRGAFGISHTHVPTETRTGHAALIGGKYEDFTAITKGWMADPVLFDSVFNQSSHTFSFGSPGILPLFGNAATPGKVDMISYRMGSQDFTKVASAHDLWALDAIRALFKNATTDQDLNASMRKEKTVFFLHLPGIDTVGHSHRPHSKEYMINIQIVDDIVRQTEALFSEFYDDNATSFVFTSDHGATKNGNHGDGDPDSTRTPLILWGAGVRGPLPDSNPSSHDEYSRPWGLTHLLRRDVEQGDVAALMSTLLGIEWPSNSVGVLPDIDHTRPGFLNATEEQKAQAALINAKVIMEHYRVKHELQKEHYFSYKPFPYFTSSEDMESSPGSSKLLSISHSIQSQRYDKAREEAAELIDQGLAGIHYIERYDRLLIRIVVTLAYLGWITYSASHIIPESYRLPLRSTLGLNITAALVLAGFWVFAQHSPRSLYFYAAFPLYFWHRTIARTGGFFFNSKKSGPEVTHSLNVSGIILPAFLALGALQVMVAGYTHRFIWTTIFLIFGIIWPLWSWPTALRHQRPALWASWSLMCVITSIFPLLPVQKVENVPEIMAGGFGMVIAGVIGAFSNHATTSSHKGKIRIIIGIQCALILLTMLITVNTASHLKANLGLPPLNQSAGRSVLAVASLLPFLLHILDLPPVLKILTFFLGFSVCFVILSISVEGLFLVAFFATLLVWVEVEVALRFHGGKPKAHKNGYRLQTGDIRTALFFLFFVQVAYFGTGNVAVIPSFHLQPVFRLVPILRPFHWASLLIFKILVPHFILAMCLALLNARLHLPPLSLFLVALTLTDVMTLTFFLNVTETGPNWMKVGQSLGYYVMGSQLVVWSTSVCALAEVLMARVLRPLRAVSQDRKST